MLAQTKQSKQTNTKIQHAVTLLLILFSNTNYKGKQGRYKAPDCWFSQFGVNLILHLMHLTSFWKYPLVSFISEIRSLSSKESP